METLKHAPKRVAKPLQRPHHSRQRAAKSNGLTGHRHRHNSEPTARHIEYKQHHCRQSSNPAFHLHRRRHHKFSLALQLINDFTASIHMIGCIVTDLARFLLLLCFFFLLLFIFLYMSVVRLAEHHFAFHLMALDAAFSLPRKKWAFGTKIGKFNMKTNHINFVAHWSDRKTRKSFENFGCV